MFAEVETDARVNALTGYCCVCINHEGRDRHPRLMVLTALFRQCPRCLRVYYCADVTSSGTQGAASTPEARRANTKEPEDV